MHDGITDIGGGAIQAPAARPFRVVIGYGDDSLRAYKVWASDLTHAEYLAKQYAMTLLYVSATDDVDAEDWDYDDELR